MKRNLILFILTLVCSSGAWAQMNFISEVKISAFGKSDLQRDGYIVVDQDLNQHEGGADVYIGYKTTTNPAEAITGLVIMESGYDGRGQWIDVRLAQYMTTPIKYRGKNYYRCAAYGSDYVDCDLNRHSGGADITLYYTKDGNTNDGGTPFIALTAVGEDKSLTGYLYTRHWEYGTIETSIDENDVYGNTNERNGSYKIYLPYQVHTHAYTATFNWADDGHSCSVTTQCACGHSSTGDATITSKVKIPATYRVDGVTTYTAKITLNNKEFTDTKDVQDIVMPLDEVKTAVKGMIDEMVAAETRANMSALGSDYKAQVDAATTREDVWAIIDAFPAALDAAAALALSQAKEAAIAEINTALGDITDATLLATIQGYKDQINAATTTAAITSIKIDALAAIAAYKAEQERLRLLAEAKVAAIAEIDAALGDITDATLLATIQGYKDQINAATVIEAIAPIKTEALAAIAAYKAEQERLRLLEEAKEAAIASIQALVSGSTDELVISTANKYIAAIEAAMVIEDVARLRSEAERIIGRLQTEPDAFEFGFIGTGNPTETQHRLEGLKMTYSEDGEQMTVAVNEAEVTYDLNNVSGMSHFRGTPTVSLTAHEDPADHGFFYTTFYSGLEAYTIPAGVTAYTASLATYDTETWMNLSEVTGGILPQGEAVLLKTTGTAITMKATNPTSATADDTNVLNGVDVATATTSLGTVYTLAGEEGVMGFYHYTGDQMPANKAYLTLPAGQAAPRRISFGSHVTTGILNVNDNDNDNDNDNVNVNKVLRNGQLYILRDGRTYNAQGALVK